MSSTNMLPVDILSEIFCFYAMDEQQRRRVRASSCQSCKPNRACKILSHVCRTWRLTTFSTPEMWRYIHIDLKSISQINSLFPSLGQVSLPRWAILAIERSGACPLELSFSNLGSDNALEVVRSLICANGALASRVERLEVGLAGQSYLPLLAVIQVAKTSNIRSVTFYHTGYFTVHETLPTETLETLQTAEMLESLALGRIQWLSPSGYTLPKVTSLSIDLGHNHEALLLQSLSAFPNLIELCLECTDHVKLTDSWEPIPSCTLPHLRTIAFDPRICHYSLHKLEAPVLDTIIAKNFSRLSPRFLEALPSRPTYSRLRLVNFVPMPDIMTGLGEGKAVGRRNTTWSSYKTLEMLKVEWTMHFKAGVAGFIECLRNHLEIVTLELDNCAINDKYLRSLAEDTTLLPDLKRLRLHDCMNVTHSQLNMIQGMRPALFIECTTS